MIIINRYLQQQQQQQHQHVALFFLRLLRHRPAPPSWLSPPFCTRPHRVDDDLVALSSSVISGYHPFLTPDLWPPRTHVSLLLRLVSSISHPDLWPRCTFIIRNSEYRPFRTPIHNLLALSSSVISGCHPFLTPDLWPPRTHFPLLLYPNIIRLSPRSFYDLVALFSSFLRISSISHPYPWPPGTFLVRYFWISSLSHPDDILGPLRRTFPHPLFPDIIHFPVWNRDWTSTRRNGTSRAWPVRLPGRAVCPRGNFLSSFAPEICPDAPNFFQDGQFDTMEWPLPVLFHAVILLFLLYISWILPVFFLPVFWFCKTKGVPKKKRGKSISSGAQYVIVHNKLDEEK